MHHCTESTVDFQFEDLSLRLWINFFDEADCLRAHQWISNDCIITLQECFSGHKTLKEVAEFVAQNFNGQQLNAVQVQRTFGRDYGIVKYGHMIYTVPF